MTTSFGSICFGSLLVAFLQTLRALAETARAQDDGGALLCIAECILSCLASLLEYFNKWAFVYVGTFKCLASTPSFRKIFLILYTWLFFVVLTAGIYGYSCKYDWFGMMFVEKMDRLLMIHMKLFL